MVEKLGAEVDSSKANNPYFVQSYLAGCNSSMKSCFGILIGQMVDEVA
jgi:hypothetical protein